MVAMKAPKGALQLPLLPPESKWETPRLADLPAWGDAKRISIDTETRDTYLTEFGPGNIGRKNSYMVGISLAIEDGPSFYLPLRHEGHDAGNMEDLDKTLAWFRHEAKRYAGTIVGMNLGYDLGWLLADQIEFNRQCRIRDVQISEAVLYELHQSYSLQNIALRWGFDGKDESLLREAAASYSVDPKLGMWRLPAKFVGPYASMDAELPLQIMRKQERKIAEDGLEQIHELESALLPALVRMRWRGVRVDEQRLQDVWEWTIVEEQKALAEVSRLSNIKLSSENLMNSEMVAKVLATQGIAPSKTEKGNISVDKKLLSSAKHPVADLILYARKVNKLRTAFAQSVRDYLVNGRIHATMNQMAREDEATGGMKGARFGRMSCEHPNLQQQPARDEFAARWRSIYIPEEGALWASCDYSQQEPRILTHFAELSHCRGAVEAADRYRNDPKTDNHQMMADLTGLPRKYAKNIFLGLCYGEGGAKLAQDLGLPTRWAVFPDDRGRSTSFFATKGEALAFRIENGGRVNEVAGEEAQDVLDRFNSYAPYPGDLSKRVAAQAKRKGFIRTLLGRRCRFPEKPDGTFDWTHKGLNRLIQGSAADQTKKSIVDVDAAGHFLQLQVHDELDLSVADRAEAEQVAHIMREGVKLTVPSMVDIEIGASWGEAK